jgi:environmental stress-induced protein Ves
MIRLLRAADHRTMPWKNGGGSTTEIAVAPAGASIDDFDWRVSTATVAADGPFSLFPGVDRVLALLEGAGLDLDGADPLRGPVRLDPHSAPVTFGADLPVAARLHRGPITDLNVMTRRGRFAARIWRAAAGQMPVVIGAGGTVLLFAMTPSRVDFDGLTIPPLSPRDVVRLDGPTDGQLAIDGIGGAVDAWVVEISPDRPVKSGGR